MDPSLHQKTSLATSGKTIARLHFNSATSRHFGTFEGKDETRHSVAEPIDIYAHEAAILKRIEELYDGGK